ncbi:MAG: PEP-CTERM sorting domain-containing protein [Colwellia sp.]|nr:PEP-CTERM sorting domain-containing protein [Colwellia sp.]MCW9080150.1 PEP-CTERM sorting domain-containing protein [Colwellia sp.]
MKLYRKIFGTILLIFSFSGTAGVIDIDFNGTQFLLGTFESEESGSDFYRYGNPFTASANPVYPGTNTPIPLEADALQIFTHINTLTNELSFGIILEKPNGSGGGSFSTTVDWSDPAVLSFVDDPNESGNLGSGGPQDISLTWVDCCTDGFIISGFDPNDLFINLTQVTGDDLTSVIFLSPDRNNTRFDFPSDIFEISLQNCDPATDPNGCVIPPGQIPEPTSLILFAIGLGLTSIRCRRKSAVVF